MCESRVCPCPQGFAEWQMGETREEGGHILDMFALGNLYKKSTPWGVLFVLLVEFSRRRFDERRCCCTT